MKPSIIVAKLAQALGCSLDRSLPPSSHVRRVVCLLFVFLVVAFGADATATTRVACVGDSITFGLDSTAGNDYPSDLGRLLGSNYQVMNFGHSSSTMMKNPPDPQTLSYWITCEFSDALVSSPDVVVIMLGTNDSTTINWNGGNNTYEADYLSMVAQFAALPTHPQIFVNADPPLLSANYGLSAPTVANYIRPIVRQVATDTGSGFIDVFAAFGSNPAQYFGAGDGQDIGDGVHPNDTGYTLIANTVECGILGTCTFDYDGGVPPCYAGAVDAGMPPDDGVPPVDVVTHDATPPDDVGPPPDDGASAVDVITHDATRVPDDAIGSADANESGQQSDAVADSSAESSPGPAGPAGCRCDTVGGRTVPRMPALFAAVCLAVAANRRRTARARRTP